MNSRIAEVRKAAGMTQEEFAAKINLSRNFIWMIEKGDRVPSDRTVADICREFGISETWLRDGIGPMRTNDDADVELEKILGEISAGKNKLLEAVLKSYWRLDEKEKAAIQKLVDGMIEESQKNKAPGE